MSDSEVRLEMRLPLDSEGFLRRECPTCEREFKWYNPPEPERGTVTVADGGYFCPYCGVQAEPNTWLTKAQVELAHNVVTRRVVDPMLKGFVDDLKRIGRSSNGMLRVEGIHQPTDELDPLTEVDDMTRVDFQCHPTEPVKVLDDWRGPVHCLICGQPSS